MARSVHTLSLTRKAFLRGVAVAAASSVLPARADAPDDVLVIGAGLAGLTAARRLVAMGYSARVLEARGRVGGRTVNLALPGGHVVEGGGEWIGPGQDRIAALAAEVGVGTFPAYYEGATTYDLRGVISTGYLPDFASREGGDFFRAAWKLDRACRALPLGDPWTAANAQALDARTLGSWLDEHATTRFTHDIFRLITRAIMAGHPERISLLWFLAYLRSGGGLLPIIQNDGGAQDQRFVGGSQAVSIEVARALGGRVLLGHPVSRVTDRPGQPVVVDTLGGTFHARRVVVAMMPADTLRIRFDPLLPELRRELCEGWARLTRLPIVKLSLTYREPFWRAAGLNGAMQSDRSPLQLVFDNSPEDGSIGVLTGFLSVVEAPGFADRAARQALVVEELVRYFGDTARRYDAYVEKDWAADPWSTGCITPLGPGLLSRAGPALRAPVGRVHWAGTETSDRWWGYMDGAVRSGERVAEELAAALT